MTLEPLSGKASSRATLACSNGSARVTELHLAASAPHAAECALGHVLEARFSLAALGVPPGGGVRFQLSLWQGGLPMDAIPQQGWLELKTTDPDELAA